MSDNENVKCCVLDTGGHKLCIEADPADIEILNMVKKIRADKQYHIQEYASTWGEWIVSLVAVLFFAVLLCLGVLGFFEMIIRGLEKIL